MDWYLNSEVLVSTDPEKIDRELIFDYLHHIAYWCRGIPYDVCMKSIDHSLPFSLISKGRQVGFARLVTDRATFAYLADVFVLEKYQGQGLGTFLIQSINDWLDSNNIRTSLLLTRDAQSLYAALNWCHPSDPKQVMRYKKKNPNFYGYDSN